MVATEEREWFLNANKCRIPSPRRMKSLPQKEKRVPVFCYINFFPSLLKSFPKLSTWAVFFFFSFFIFHFFFVCVQLKLFHSLILVGSISCCVRRVYEKFFFFHYYYLFYGQVRLFDSVCCWCRCESSRLESERERECREKPLL